MTCQELDARLDDWLDGALAPEETRAVEAHLSGCPGCREAERKLRRLLAHAAALPRSLTPPRDLWPQIERRVARPGGWSWLVGGHQPLVLAAAATAVLGVVAVVSYPHAPAVVRTVAIPAADTSAGTAARTVSTDGSTVADPVLAAAERDYEAAANALLEALQRRKASLTPEARAAIDGNLEVIDRALLEVRQALAKDPANPELNRMLVSTHRKKVDVLRRVVRLSTAL